MILIKNIYYMLAYAFTSLKSKGYADMSAEEFDNIADLLTEILIRGINQQIRYGLKRDYIDKTESLASPRGKIEITASLNDSCMNRGRLICTHDDYSLNSYLNRVVKTAGIALLKSDASKDRKKRLRGSLAYLYDVPTLDSKSINWNNRFNRSDRTYRMLFFISKLAIEGMLHSGDSGSLRLEDFSEEDLARLFEHFILEYYRREHSDTVNASAQMIDWALDNDFSDYLPTMRTDITLTRKHSPHDILIIDTKFYASNMQSRFDKKSVISSNLYQIFTYVKNKEVTAKASGKDIHVSGMLLYARTDSDFQPDATYQMSGTPISVKTLDLNQDFAKIKSQLDSLR